MSDVLVIGYGNPLRRDDGAGPLVAGRFDGRPGVRAVVTHQLVPELADDLAACRRVVFVDAIVGAERVEANPLEPSCGDVCLGHVGDPAWLLGLTLALHGRRPDAWLVTVPAADVGVGEGLSPETDRHLPAAVEAVGRLCTTSG